MGTTTEMLKNVPKTRVSCKRWKSSSRFHPVSLFCRLRADKRAREADIVILEEAMFVCASTWANEVIFKHLQFKNAKFNHRQSSRMSWKRWKSRFGTSRFHSFVALPTRGRKSRMENWSRIEYPSRSNTHRHTCASSSSARLSCNTGKRRERPTLSRRQLAIVQIT